VAGIVTTQHASVFVVEIKFTEGPSYFIKTKCGIIEKGGSFAWGTGVQS
jgi:hypothetical protein